MKFVTLTALAAFAVVSAAPAMAADTTTRTSDNLNRQQVVEYNQFMTTRPAETGTYVTGQPQVGYADTDAAASDTPTDVLVVGPAHDASETQREPTTNPPSAGQPAIDQPYIAVQPKPDAE